DVRSAIDTKLDAAALPFRDNSFDVVLLSEVIEHVSEAPLVFREINRILRPGGSLLLTWPFICPLHEVPKDYARYTEFGMENMLRASGFRIEVIERRGDVLCVFLAILEQFTLGSVELLVRIPLAGPKLFAPFKSLLSKVLCKAWKKYF